MKATKNKVLYFGGLLLSLVLACAVSVAVIQIFLPKAIVAWDEAANMVWGHKIYDALRNHEWRTAGGLSRVQVYYPPLQSWFIGTTSLITGFSIPIVRITNLLWLLVIAPLIFHVGYSLQKSRNGFITGLSATVLFLMSPMTLALSSIALKELMGTAITLISYMYYRRMEERNRLRDAIIAGCFVLVLFYFKYNYALLLCAGYAVLCGINIVTKMYKDYRPMIVFWLVTIFGMVFWVFVQNTRLITEHVQAQTPQTVHIGSWMDKALFYPQSIIFVYAPHVIAGLFMVAAFFGSIVWIRNKAIRALWWIVIVYIIPLGFYSENLHERYIFPVMPFVYVLTAHVAVCLGDFLLKARRVPIFIIMYAGLFLMVIHYSLRLPGAVYSVGAHALRSPIFNQPDYRDTIFDFNPSHWSKRLPPAGSQTPSDVISYVLSVVGPAHFTVIGNINELSPKYWELSALLAHRNTVPPQVFPDDYLVTVEVMPGSRFYTRDYMLFNMQSAMRIPDIATSRSHLVVGKKVFSELGITVTIYKDPQRIVDDAPSVK